ncbi:hypothetical protein SCHPADRAFT_899755 [Schizopora paradoxa]|uniref:Rho guanine nucleotide exchange factor scd1 n=1 Tax=Schizopora paradoxa TaxID=27342 RepID=A0A0H2S2V5_9AGAM|nr:hypothetical protein SCHPADRAFT_899755 [Schizopora paradoxa]
MSSVAGRKKSVIHTGGLQIETPVAHNTFLNKSAAQSISLYQQCNQLRAQLLLVHNFAPYFAIATPQPRTSTDPVNQLWDCFALGVPLCFLFNLLPHENSIDNINTTPENFDPSDEKLVKKAILHFAMAIAKSEVFDKTDHFLATQLLDRKSTDGFVKVLSCVSKIVDQLPKECFQEAPPQSPPTVHPSDSTDSLPNLDSPAQPDPVSAQEKARNNTIREIVETERKYVQDLEHMQRYANTLSSTSAISQDTIHLLFPNLNKLLDFQRRFLIKLETCAELPWKEQRWGVHFVENEREFAVYEPYCANYSEAIEIFMAVEQSLTAVTLISTGELPAFLIKPIQRICKYPLLLEALVKAASGSDYPYFDELKQGLDAAKRITDRINEAQRRQENVQTVKSLEARVEDWKGHHLSNFGELILDDIFMVMKMEIDREYHVFLFEKIILCCKELLPQTPGSSNRKNGKSNSIIKKQQQFNSANLPGGVGPPRKKSTPLLLKGRIFLNNVTHTVPSNHMGNYSLQVWWRGDDDNEYFTLRCRTEEQLKLWKNQIDRLIEKTAARKNSEASQHRMHMTNSTNPSQSRMLYEAARSSSSSGTVAYRSQQQPMYPSPTQRYRPNVYDGDDGRSRTSSIPNSAYFSSSSGAGPSGYPPDDDFEPEEDFEEYPPASYPQPSSSGRGTPLDGRARAAQSMVHERDYLPGAYDPRPRAMTEDQNGPVMRQWRNNRQPLPPPPPPPVGTLPNPGSSMGRAQPPQLQRYASDASEASFSAGASVRPQLTLRSKFSSNRLNSNYEVDSERAASPMSAGPRVVRPTRSRSASQPSAYHPPQSAQDVPPPLPKQSWMETSAGSVTSSADSSKRGSGSSLSTGGSSDSPHSTSPITPYGSSDSSLTGPSLRTSRSQMFGDVKTPPSGGVPIVVPMVKVKVHFNEDIFVIQVPRSTEFQELVERVGRKIRLCGPRREDGPLKVKYVDEDGDMICLGSTEDVQMAFETLRPNNQVTLYVS